jgi:hypothetical protein
VVGAAREPAMTVADLWRVFSPEERGIALAHAGRMTTRILRAAVTLVLGISLGGCIESGRSKARDGSDVSDDFDQQQWATTSPVGDSSEESGAYYGAPGPSSEPSPVRRAANPEPAATRTPASPQIGSD